MIIKEVISLLLGLLVSELPVSFAHFSFASSFSIGCLGVREYIYILSTLFRHLYELKVLSGCGLLLSCILSFRSSKL